MPLLPWWHLEEEQGLSEAAWKELGVSRCCIVGVSLSSPYFIKMWLHSHTKCIVND